MFPGMPSTGIAMLILGLAFPFLWNFWKRHIILVSGPKSLLTGLALLLFSLLPTSLLFQGLTSGVVICLSRTCRSGYDVHEKPVFFWITMSVIYAVCLLLFVPAAYVFYRLAKDKWAPLLRGSSE
jgi:hypothetical protein